jgi:hypothetical protein
MEFKKWKNIPKFEDLEKDYTFALSHYNDQIGKLDKYNRLIDESTPVSQKKGNRKAKSRYQSKLARKQIEWIIPKLENAILSQRSIFQLDPKSGTAITFSNKNRKILNHQWDRDIGKMALVNSAARKFVKEGSCVLKLGWFTKTKKKTIQEKVVEYTTDKSEMDQILVRASGNEEMYVKLQEMAKNEGRLPVSYSIVEKEIDVVVENRPRPEVRDNRAIIIDPTAKGVWNNVKFLIDIQETDYATIRQNDSYFNLEHIKNYVTNLSSGSNEYTTATQSVTTFAGDFEFSDTARKKITMYEYWGYWDINDDGKLISIVASWIGKKLVRLERNPYPHNEIPYAVAAYSPVDNEFWGEPDSILVEDDQKGLTGVMRAMQDITNESAIGQEFIDTSMFESPIERIAYENGETVNLKKGADAKEAIYRKTVEPVPSVMFDMKSIYNEHAMLLTGVQDMDGGQKQIGQSVTGSPMPLSPATNREMEIQRRFNSLFERYGKLTLAMNKEYLLDDAYYGSSNDAEAVGDTSQLREDYNVTVSVSTQTINNDKASKVMYLLHNNGGNMSPMTASLHYAETARLWGLERLADAVMDEAMAPPSEEQIMMQQLELERVKLENNRVKLDILLATKDMEVKDAKILEIETALGSGAAEAKVLKDKALAELSLAQADKMDTQVDLFKQEFQLIDDGTKRTQDKQDKEYQHLANLQREEVRTEREMQLNEKKKSESDSDKKSSREKNVEYIKEGTLSNDSYDPADDVFRGIRDKNSLDTTPYTDGMQSIEPMPSVQDVKDLPEPADIRDDRADRNQNKKETE